MADVAGTALAYIAFAEKVAEEPGFYVPSHLRDPAQIIRELLAENERLRGASQGLIDMLERGLPAGLLADLKCTAAYQDALAALAGEGP